jgi:hypothetical protein
MIEALANASFAQLAMFCYIKEVEKAVIPSRGFK